MSNKSAPAIILMDLETTGLDCNTHEIIDTCAIILTRKLEIIKEFNTLSLPDYLSRAHPKALEINRYNTGTWKAKGAVSQGELAHMFSDFINDIVGNRSIRLIPAGHRVPFDIGFINTLMEENDLDISMDNRRFIDTLVLEDSIRIARSISEGRSTRPSAKSFESLARSYGVKMSRDEYHTARGDTHATLAVLRRQISFILGKKKAWIS